MDYFVETPQQAGTTRKEDMRHHGAHCGNHSHLQPGKGLHSHGAVINSAICRLLIFCLFAIFLTAGTAAGPAAAQPAEPSLPPGLGSGAGAEGPALPAGLGEEKSAPGPQSGAPALPAGLGHGPAEKAGTRASPEDEGASLPFELSGFWEMRIGARTGNDPHERDLSLAETRLALELERYWDGSSFQTTVDLLYDAVLEEDDTDLEEGTGLLDLREFRYAATPVGFMDIKAGRQILTWGTGDLLFLNDMFPKDYRSFFSGRDGDYLKAPSDAVKISLFGGTLDLPVNLDLVYTPRFDPDRFVDGRRISYWNPLSGRRAGRDHRLETRTPDEWFTDDEIALRLYENVRGYELALYGYWGFWKSPAGIIPGTSKFYHPELAVYGASVEGTFLRGIGSLEIAWYDSREDESGEDPRVDNGQFRLLAGYEQEAAKNFTVAGQYYLEHMLDYEAYLRTLPAGRSARDENRHVLTLRLTRALFMQTLELSLFTFYSPSDDDAYLRPRISYDLGDHWRVEAGGNIFLADRPSTFFGQFEDNTNVYAGLRYSF